MFCWTAATADNVAGAGSRVGPAGIFVFNGISRRKQTCFILSGTGKIDVLIDLINFN